jgi:hypothetical protein
MSYKGFLRSMNSTINKMERASRRIQKEQEQRRKQIEKLGVLEQAKFEVDEYENYIELIQSMHKDCSEPINWVKISNLEQPIKPEVYNANERRATQRRETYAPNFIDRIFKLEQKKIKKLDNKILEAKIIDEKENTYHLNRYEKEYEEWRKSTEIASKVLLGDQDAYYEVIKEMSPFEEIENLGSSIGFYVVNRSFVVCGVNIYKDDVIPKEEKKLSKSGKLTTKEIPVSRFNTIYQDHVCSAALRVAREMFSLLPIEKALVNAIAEAVNTETGNLEKIVILSVLIPKKTIDTINFDLIDPSDCMNNFICNMNFKKSTGFNKVEEIDYEKYI